MFQDEPAKGFCLVVYGEATLTYTEEQKNITDFSLNKDLVVVMPVQQPIAPIKFHINNLSTKLRDNLKNSEGHGEALHVCN
jgi:hypothetical protein